MKQPRNFDRQWYYTVKDEATRVAREIVNQVVLGREKKEFIKVEVDPDISYNMNTYDLDRFLNYFNCPGLYITSAPGKRNYIVTVRSDLVRLNMLAHVSRVSPIRVK